jgi:uncharacterized protein YciI
MTDEERRLMEAHSRYFDEHFAAGRLLLYGPVMTTSGAFGLAVLEVESEAEARLFGEGDPSVRAGLNRFEICPMRVSAARARNEACKEGHMIARIGTGTRSLSTPTPMRPC